MNLPQDVTLPATAGTVRLHRGAETKDVLVENAAPLLGYDVRVTPYPSMLSMNGGFFGDERNLAVPFALRILVNKPTEAGARAEIDALHGFAIDTEHVQHLELGKFRALHAGRLGDFLPSKINGNFRAWWVDVTFLPMFAEATGVKTTDEATYITETGSPA